MIEDCPEPDIEFDAPQFTSVHKLRSAECFCSRATLDDLLADEVMGPVLRRAGPLPAEHVRNGMRIERGRIYVAPPNHHMTVGPIGFIRLDQGPREHHTRPAADPLFRSAAGIYGSPVIRGLLSRG